MSDVEGTEKTHIRCKAIIEVLGKPKEHVQEALASYIEKISDDPDLIILEKEITAPEEKEKLWATFVELEMVIKGIPKIIAFCFEYMPSSIQIVKPAVFALPKSAIEGFLNNLQARLHNVDMVVKQLKNENRFLKKNMNLAVRNVILVSLAKNALDKEHLKKITGIHESELQLFLDMLEKENKIQQKEGIYHLIVQKNVER